MIHGSHRHRAVLGLVLNGQTIALLAAVLATAVLVGLAIVSWIERMP